MSDKHPTIKQIRGIVQEKMINKVSPYSYEDLSEKIFGEGNCYSESEVRKRMYGIKYILEVLDDELHNKVMSNADDEIIQDLEEKIKVFEKEKIKFQDQKREYRKYLREDARWEHIQESIKTEIEKINETKPLYQDLKGQAIVHNNVNREAILVLSDWHIGMDIDSYWNVFNIDVAKSRVEHLINEVIRYCEEQYINTLHVSIQGDMISGLIHTGTRIEASENSIQQTMIVSELLSDLVVNLSVYIPRIKVYNTHGNHARVISAKNDSIEAENFEKIIDWYMKSRLIDFDNIEFPDTIIDDEIVEIDIFGEKIYAVHGHNDKLGNTINKITQMTRTFPTMIIMGHYHRDYQTEEFDTTLVVNGSLCGMDSYARKLRLNNTPHQKLIVFDEKCGELCTYKIRLNEV